MLVHQQLYKVLISQVVYNITYCINQNLPFMGIRDRSLITSQGVGAVVLEEGYNFKTSPFLGGKFFTGEKHEGGQIL